MSEQARPRTFTVGGVTCARNITLARANQEYQRTVRTPTVKWEPLPFVSVLYKLSASMTLMDAVVTGKRCVLRKHRLWSSEGADPVQYQSAPVACNDEVANRGLLELHCCCTDNCSDLSDLALMKATRRHLWGSSHCGDEAFTLCHRAHVHEASEVVTTYCVAVSIQQCHADTGEVRPRRSSPITNGRDSWKRRVILGT